jgi:phage-related protein
MSTIRVYDKNTMIFDHNGICALEPSSCVITRNLENYTYFLELTYPIYLDDKWKELVEHRIIHVKDSRFNEYFRIKLIKKTNEEVISFIVKFKDT